MTDCLYKFQASRRSRLCWCKLTELHWSQQSDDQWTWAENISHCLQGLLAEGRKVQINSLHFHFLAHCISWKIVAGFHLHIITEPISPNRAPVVCGHTRTIQPPSTWRQNNSSLRPLPIKLCVTFLHSSFSSLERESKKSGGAVMDAWDALWCCPSFQEGLVA